MSIMTVPETGHRAASAPSPACRNERDPEPIAKFPRGPGWRCLITRLEHF